jgi:predicted GIY-YIG superfamily endonuclease
MSRHEWDRPHWVYRFFDEAGSLLYIGMTEDFEKRLSVHFCTGMPKWSEVAGAEEIRARYHRHDLVEYPDYFTAHAAEVEAIKSEAPELNRQHNPKRWRCVHGIGYIPAEQVPA